MLSVNVKVVPPILSDSTQMRCLCSSSIFLPRKAYAGTFLDARMRFISLVKTVEQVWYIRGGIRLPVLFMLT